MKLVKKLIIHDNNPGSRNESVHLFMVVTTRWKWVRRYLVKGRVWYPGTNNCNIRTRIYWVSREPAGMFIVYV